MDVHPLIVHFPIALLMVYAFFEIVRIPVIRHQSWNLPLRAILAVFGTVGGFFAIWSGDEAADSISGSLEPILEAHEAFATATIWVFGIMALLVLVAWIARDGRKYVPVWFEKPFNLLKRLHAIFIDSWFGIVLAIIAVVLISVTGALGGSMVYGPDADPLANLMWDIFSE